MNIQSVLDLDLCVRVLALLGHFVWQGAALGIAAALVSLALKRKSAALRHNLYLTILCAMALCPVVTFVISAPRPQHTQIGVMFTISEGVPAPADAVSSAPVLPGIANEPVNSAGALDEQSQNLPATPPSASPEPVALVVPSVSPVAILNWRAYAPFIAAVYFLGVLLLLIRLAVGVIGGGRLRRRSRPVAEGELLASLARGAEALGMRFAPALAFCEGVAVPTVVGVIRPMVLLPVAIAAGFTPQQVEWLLLHELAHIRRRDHLINLFQRLVEAVLFYHPAVWFVSNRIRIEREHCCDDRVVTLGGTAHEYAGALVTAAALCTGRGTITTESALAAVNKPGHLRARIERLLGGPGPSLRLGRGSWLVAAVLGATAVLTFNVMASGGKANAPVAPTAVATAVVQPVATAVESAVVEPVATAVESAASAQSPQAEPTEPVKLAQEESESAAPSAKAGDASKPASPSAAGPSKGLLPDYDKLAPEIQELVTQLDDPDWWLRKLAVQQLAERNDPHLVTLAIPRLSDSDKRVQAAAAEALGKAADPCAIKHLVAVLEQKGEVSDAAANALTHFPAEKVLALLKLAAADDDMRLGALNALSRWDRPEVLDILFAALPSVTTTREANSGSVESLRDALVAAWSKQSPEKSAEKLAEASKSLDARTRAGVAELYVPSLRRNPRIADGVSPSLETLYRNPRSVDILIPLLNDSDRDVRAVAVMGLAGMTMWSKGTGVTPAPPVVDAMSKRLRDRDWSICEYSAEVLEKAGWQPSGPEDRAWYLVGRLRSKEAVPLGDVAVDPLLHFLQSGKSNPFRFTTPVRPAPRSSSLETDAISALGELKSQRAVPVLVALLKGPFGNPAASALGQIGGAAAADGLVSALAMATDDTRWACLGSLAKLKDARAVAPLVATLTNEDYKLREFAVRSLMLYEGTKSLTEAVPVQDSIKMLSSEDANIQHFAVDMLQSIEDPQVASAMITVLESSDFPDANRGRAAEYLGDKKVAAAVDPLTRVLFNEKPDKPDKGHRMHVSVVHALGQIGGAKAFDALVALLSAPGPDTNTVKEAVNALAASKNPNAVGPLSQLLIKLASTNDSPVLRRVVAESLGALGGRDAAAALADGAKLSVRNLPSQEVRIEMYAAALKKIAPPYSTDALYDVLQLGWGGNTPGVLTPNEAVLVAQTLAELGDSRAEESLKSLTTFPETRIPAGEALKKLHEKIGQTPPPGPTAAAVGSKEQ